MNIEILEKKENKLLNRTEVHFKVIHEGEKTPERELVKNDLAEMLKTKKENIILQYLKPEFGIQQSIGYAKVYKSIEDARRVEREYILKRNKIEKEIKEKPAEEKEEHKEEKETEETKVEKTEEETEETKEGNLGEGKENVKE